MDLKYPVSTIDDMYHACDPDKPLYAAHDERYRDLSTVRGQRKSWINNIARNISRNQQVGKHFSMLFSGHRGSGKTTELYQLKNKLEADKFFVVYLDIENILDMNDIEYQDVLLNVANALFLAMEEKNWQLNDDLLENLSDWFADKIVEQDRKTSLEAELKSEAEAGLKTFFGGLLIKLTTALKVSSTQREVIRKNIERNLSVFKSHLQRLITDSRQKIQKAGFVDLVIIVDGLEKLLYVHDKERQHNNHYELFILHAEQLKWVNSHIIYTVPITLASQTNLKTEFSEMLVMPMVKVSSEEGKEALCDLIARRIKIEAVFENKAYVDELIILSGGAIRDLMILLRNVTETDGDKIVQDDIQYAKQALIKFYSRQLITLTEADKQVLQAIHRKQPNEHSDSYARLTNNRIILEYENGELWQALHPAVLKIETIQTLLNANSA
ncbi:hypothetical protein [Candidatus Albibeggiatoa sp. nov. BB20]|uniref:hypothetical protein n=1 Tax=Candidatus Albibeggiatoa sp. nov. BB20 TaxID=3162723 RepID=UPI0033656C7D